jgi:DNA polymerase (family X)
VAAPILAGLRALPQVRAGRDRREPQARAGDDRRPRFHRGRKRRAPVVDWFTAQPGVLEVTAKGETKASVRFEGGCRPTCGSSRRTVCLRPPPFHRLQGPQRADAPARPGPGHEPERVGPRPAAGEGTAKDKAGAQRGRAARRGRRSFRRLGLSYHPARAARGDGRDRGGRKGRDPEAGRAWGPPRGVPQPHDGLRRQQHAGGDGGGGAGARLGVPRDRRPLQVEPPGQRAHRGAPR